MSEENRSAVESAVQELLKGNGGPSVGPLSSQESNHGLRPSTSSSGSHARLLQMGFSVENIDKACGALGKDSSIARLLDWLCLHLPENELPRSMASSKCL